VNVSRDRRRYSRWRAAPGRDKTVSSDTEMTATEGTMRLALTLPDRERRCVRGQLHRTD
jgi:hypothetical protein